VSKLTLHDFKGLPFAQTMHYDAGASDGIVRRHSDLLAPLACADASR
jgi:hypothetical protein